MFWSDTAGTRDMYFDSIEESSVWSRSVPQRRVNAIAATWSRVRTRVAVSPGGSGPGVDEPVDEEVVPMDVADFDASEARRGRAPWRAARPRPRSRRRA